MMDRSRNVEDVLPPGTRIEEFVIERELQSGGFGVTYLAQDRSLGRQVAIKEYLPREWGGRRSDGSVGPRSSSCAKDYQWGLTRFLEEARTLARLDHPRIVRVHRVIEAWGTAYMVMEYVEGRDLEEALKAEGPWPEERVRGLLDSLLPGLALVHGAGLIHRDIKPANVMLRADGTPVLIDFGSARYAAGVHSHSLTSVLTPGYAPQEQYHQASGQQGAWTDVYALGAVAYRALSGQAPVEAPRRVEAAARRQPDPLAPVSQAAAGGVSESFGAAVTSALAVFSEGRPRDVAAWRAQWDAAEDGGATGEDEAGKDDGGRSGSVAPPVFTGGLGAQPGSRRPWIRRAARPVAYGAAALVVVAGLAFGIMNRVGGGGAGGGVGGAVTAGGGAGGAVTDGWVVTELPVSPPAVTEPPVSPPAVTEPPVSPPAVTEPPVSPPAVTEPPVSPPVVTAQRSEEALALDRAAWSAIQTGLAREGFDPGAPDGVGGPATRAAIRRWQTARGLPATGYLDAASMRELREAGSDVADTDADCSRSMGLLGRRTYTRRDALDGSCSTEHYPAGEHALYYGFTLDEAATVTLEMTSVDVDSWLALRSGSPPGVVVPLEEDDDGGTGLDARIERPLVPGSYTIEATTLDPGETGDFTLRVTVSAVGGGCSRSMGLLGTRTYTRGDILDGSCSTEHYPDGEHALYYGFTLDEAADVTMEMTALDMDSWLALRRGSSPGSVEPLAEDDDGGTGVDARIERSLAPGSYTIEATTRFAGETGNFTLTVTVNGTDEVPYERELLVDGAFSAAIESAGDEDTYRITVSSPGRLTVHTTGVTDTFGELLDASGNVLGSDDDGGSDTNFRLTWPVSPGTYYVRVRHFADDGTGDYAVIARLATP